MAVNPNMEAIETVTVGATSVPNITFSNIPQTYTDLVIYFSLRNVNASVSCFISFNGNSANFTLRELVGSGSIVFSQSSSTNSFQPLATDGTNWTANTFGNGYIYIPNYTSNTNKSFSIDSVTENNSTTAYAGIIAGLWSNTSAITSITITAALSGNFAQHTTATLYGITSAAVGAKATGGIIYQDADYFYHTFTQTGTFTPTQALTTDIMVVAGGGGSGYFSNSSVGGGGAGGFRVLTAQALLNGQAYTATVGAGGAGGTSGTSRGSNGVNSSFSGSSITTITSTGGGGGAGTNSFGTSGAQNGGSGGGGSNSDQTAGTGNSGSYSPAEGNNGGTGAGNFYSSGGGGGAGGAGGNGPTSGSVGAPGGVGNSSYSSWGSATSTGQNSGGTYYYAGGGGGGGAGGGAGGLGGGGAGGSLSNGTNGTANTGGGAGGGQGSGTGVSATGGSGIVIIRYAK